MHPSLEQKPSREKGRHGKPTPVSFLPVLAGIALAGLRREAATLVLARKAKKHAWLGCFNASMQKWGLADSAAYDPEHSADHIINTCPYTDHPQGPASLSWVQRCWSSSETLNWTSAVTRKKKNVRDDGVKRRVLVYEEHPYVALLVLQVAQCCMYC